MKGYIVKIAARGFGFASTTDGSGDVFISPSQLDRTPGIGVGDAVEFNIAIDHGNGRRFATSLRLDQDALPRRKYRGTVKGNPYNLGYCFVSNADHGDLFLHKSVIDRAGLTLQPGDAVAYEFEVSKEPGHRHLVTKVWREAPKDKPGVFDRFRELHNGNVVL
jgi:cold shock CspA family protein